MQKFKFKLQGLLKLREFKEYKVKLELGELAQEINRIQSALLNQQSGLERYSRDQEALLKSGINSGMLLFYMQLMNAASAKIKQLGEQLQVMQSNYEKKLQQLAQCRAEVKLIQQLKDKELQEFKRQNLKKMEAEIDDLVQIRSHFKQGENL